MRVTSAERRLPRCTDEQAKNENASSSSSICWKLHIGDTPADDGVVEHGMVIEAEVAGRTLKFLPAPAKLGTLCLGSDLKVF